MERVVSNSTKFSSSSLSKLTLFLEPPKDKEHSAAEKIQMRQRRKIRLRRDNAAVKMQSLLRMKGGMKVLERKRIDCKATVIQRVARRKMAEKVLVVKKLEYSAAVTIQTVVRRIRDTERFFKVAKKVRQRERLTFDKDAGLSNTS
jgi:hypothetical protein